MFHKREKARPPLQLALETTNQTVSDQAILSLKNLFGFFFLRMCLECQEI